MSVLFLFDVPELNGNLWLVLLNVCKYLEDNQVRLFDRSASHLRSRFLDVTQHCLMEVLCDIQKMAAKVTIR